MYIGSYYDEDWEWDGSDEKRVRRDKFAISFDEESLMEFMEGKRTYRNETSVMKVCDDGFVKTVDELFW